MTSQEIYEAGYALPIYNISRTERWWRYKDKVFSTPIDVKTKEIQGLKVLEEKQYEDINLVSCMQIAYDQIKNRKGTLLPNGVFVKE